MCAGQARLAGALAQRKVVRLAAPLFAGVHAAAAAWAFLQRPPATGPIAGPALAEVERQPDAAIELAQSSPDEVVQASLAQFARSTPLAAGPRRAHSTSASAEASSRARARPGAQWMRSPSRPPSRQRASHRRTVLGAGGEVFGDPAGRSTAAGHEDGLGAVAQSSVLGHPKYLFELCGLPRAQREGGGHAPEGTTGRAKSSAA